MAFAKPPANSSSKFKSEIFWGFLDLADAENLSKKLFGVQHEEVEESSDDDEDTVDQEVHSVSLWHDDDDIADNVQVPNSKSVVFLRRSSDSGGCVPSNEYQRRLRKTFYRQKRSPPRWASLTTRSPVQKKFDDSDEDLRVVFDDMTRSSIRYVDKDPYLVKDIISTFRWHDVTIGHRDSRQINVVLFHHVRPVVITGGTSGKVQLFKVGDRSETGNFLQNVQFNNFPITSMSLMQGGCSLVCGSLRQGFLMKYDLEKGCVMQLQLPKCVPPQNVGRFSLSNDGSFLAMIAHSSQVHVLSLSSMELIKTFSAPAEVTSIQFLPGSSRELWAMTECGEVVIWDLNGSQQIFRDNGAVHGTKIRLSDDRSKVACGSNTGIINLYDTTDVRNCIDPKPRAIVSNLLTSCDSIAFNHDCQLMAFSSNVKKNQVKLLHVASGSVFSNFPKRHEKMSNVECVEFSPHSAYMGIGCTNGQLILERLNYFENY